MCDYSLCGLPNRLAQEGEEFVVHKFRPAPWVWLLQPIYHRPNQPARPRRNVRSGRP